MDLFLKIESLNTRAIEVADNLEKWNDEIDKTKESIKTHDTNITKLTKEITEQKTRSHLKNTLS
jgi:peptidoglycan hydrolase CwlO-like protein